jgi:uncharacterized protein YgiM (DUF1202 family)
MADRFGPTPPDEPIIGGSYPPSGGAPPLPVIGAHEPAPGEEIIGYYAAPAPEDTWSPPYGETDGYDGEAYEDGAYDEGYEYYEDYQDENPARQPMFYVFLALAALVGGAFIFLLYSIVSSGDDEEEPLQVTAQFDIRIDQPVANERIETGKEFLVATRATASEPLTLLELLVQDRVVDQQSASPPAGDGVYSGSFKWQFETKGEYQIAIRVTSETGTTRDSQKVKVIAIEGVGDKPVSITGKVLTTVNVRAGPGEQFDAVSRLSDGQEVRIIGKTEDGEWLLIDFEGAERWVKRQAIDVQESLALVPRRDPTPTPVPPPTRTPIPPTPVPSPSPLPTATPVPAAPDFAPLNALLIDGGRTLRVTVGNQGTVAYAGPLVVAVGNVLPGTLTKAFGVQIPANGSTTVDFELNPPVTTQKSASVKVNPDNAVAETNQDNDTATFVLTPPVEPPAIVMTPPDFKDNAINITVQNNGGDMPASQVTVKVTMTDGGNAAEQTKSIALAKGQSAPFTVTKPGAGPAKIQVLLNGTPVASQDAVIP